MLRRLKAIEQFDRLGKGEIRRCVHGMVTSIIVAAKAKALIVQFRFHGVIRKEDALQHTA